jgi:hypothetical protein
MIGRGYTNVIVSNHVPELPDLAEEGLGIKEYFSEIYTSALMGYESLTSRYSGKCLSNLTAETLR